MFKRIYLLGVEITLLNFVLWRDGRILIRSHNGRVLGEVVSGKTYWTSRSAQHFFVKFNGFGISESVLEELLNYGIQYIVFDYFGKEGRSAYRIGIYAFIKHSDKYIDDSWGRPDLQYVCALKHMVKIKGVG